MGKNKKYYTKIEKPPRKNPGGLRRILQKQNRSYYPKYAFSEPL